jgi:alpha/beta hydrolase fold
LPARQGFVERTVPFAAGDGTPCTLVNVRSEAREPTRGPVVLVHGAGVRANIFRAPIETTIVDYLVDRGYDVWLENWRASIDLPPSQWTLDQAAEHDHPKAVQTIVEQTGVNEIKAVIHCQGSTSFMMSALAGLVPEVTTIVANAVSLHTVIPGMSRFKIRRAAPIVAHLTPYLDPRWDARAPALTARMLALFVRMTHRECDNLVCRMASFTYGTGHPTLWRHEQIDDGTHEWIRREFGAVPFTFFAQMARCVEAGHLVSVGDSRRLPRSFAAQEPQTDARFALFAGELNRCFLPIGQRRTYEFLDAHRPGYHTLNILPGYTHLDVFIGKNAARDAFPLIAAELER